MMATVMVDVAIGFLVFLLFHLLSQLMPNLIISLENKVLYSLSYGRITKQMYPMSFVQCYCFSFPFVLFIMLVEPC